jgi:hypothetical protein
MTEIKEEQWAKAHAAVYGPGGAPPKDPNFFRFEAVLIDSSMLRPDPATWFERFSNLLKSAKVFGPEDALPKIYVLSDSKSRSRLDDYRIKGIHDFSYKPLDKRFMVQKLQAFTPQLVTMREPENPPWVPCEIQAKLGREVVMDDVAEFGLSILHPSAFREKSFMRFFSPLFGEEGEWISGRCHVCTKAEEGENQHCQFFFFGPHEDLLQRIRRWIREDHVARKEKS